MIHIVLKPFILLLAVVGLASTALAIPLDNLAERDQLVGPIGAQCSYWDNEWYDVFTVDVSGLWIADGGQGFKDNVYTQCGWERVESWNFWYTSGGAGDPDADGTVTFNVVKGYPQNCVENSIWLASSPTYALTGKHCEQTPP